MGLKDLLFNKAEKALKDAISPEEDANMIKNDEVEKASYCQYSYKNVQKLREKGKYYAVDVPYLQHPVTKQEKPRTLFLVLGVLYAMLAVAALVLSVIVVFKFLIPIIGSALEISSMAKIKYWDIFGLVALFTSLGPILMWLIVILIVIAIIGVNAVFISQTIRMFWLSKISMQEMARGYEVGGMLLRLGTVIGITLVVGITILVLTRENIKPQGIALIVGIMVLVSAVIGTIFGLIFVQRKKARKDFEELPEEQQQDFIRHNRALDRVRRYKNKRDKSLFGSSEVDF